MRVTISSFGTVYMNDERIASIQYAKGTYMVVWYEDDLPPLLSAPTRDDAVAYVLAELWD